MRHIIKQVLKEEVDSKYKEKLSRLSDNLIKKVYSNIKSIDDVLSSQEGPQLITFNYIKSLYGLPDEYTKIIYDTFRNERNDLSLKWLKENFNDLKEEKIYTTVKYYDNNDNIIFLYYDDEELKKFLNTIKINYDLIWKYLMYVFGMSHGEVENVIKLWLKEKYNITNLKPVPEYFD